VLEFLSSTYTEFEGKVGALECFGQAAKRNLREKRVR
jgi:hypothetical protein